MAHSVQASPSVLAAGITSGLLSGTAVAAGSSAMAGSTKVLNSILMTKTQIAVLTGLTLALAVPLGLQHSQLNEHRAGIPAGNFAEQSSPTPPGSASPQVDPGQLYENEMAQLRKRAESLREKIRIRQEASSVSSSENNPPNPTMLALGRSIAIADLSFAGNSTPESALQSLLAYQRDGDLAGFFGMMLFPPEAIDELARILSSEDQREKLSKQLRAMALGATLQSEIEVLDDGSSSEPRHTLSQPGDPQSPAMIEVLEMERLDDRRIQFAVKLHRGSTVRTDALAFGLTSSGWKQIAHGL